ncbi:hypothetical protein EDC14_100330 [Hydrogenispora ethanolica]|uniref:Uncharacterized protein n=1 Tax=Hydrogenispora ethanolica TaxID=1082276 RepID=A0A4R1S892_HYDET|nr:hypothetical protein [Hydrogenispora ethanolica]TCL75100.1 hypothetical protein EDC14_100330 [Hydrogenispora ethanolica]
MASFQISVRVSGPGRVRSKLKIATAANEPFPDLDGIMLESNLIDARSHRLRIQFKNPPAETVPEAPAPEERNSFWEKVRSRLGGVQLHLPL